MTNLISELNRERGQSHVTKGSIYLGAFLAVLVAAYGISFPFILPAMQDYYHQRFLSMSQVLLTMHFVGGGIALLISPIQFMIYRKNRTLHRYLGRVYFVAIIFASIGGYYMAWHAFGGIVSTAGLGILSTLWWSFTLLAVIHARAGNIAAHRQWMIRSFALTYAAVTLRVMNPLLGQFFDEVTMFQIVYWLSWTTNLAVAQWWLSRSEAGATGVKGKLNPA